MRFAKNDEIYHQNKKLERYDIQFIPIFLKFIVV
jgi:hypothetical protein